MDTVHLGDVAIGDGTIGGGEVDHHGFRGGPFRRRVAGALGIAELEIERAGCAERKRSKERGGQECYKFHPSSKIALDPDVASGPTMKEKSKTRTAMHRASEFADLAGVTVRTLHHYDRLGLLKPHRNGSGYRLYRESDLERLEQIVALKFLGLPLKDIRELLDSAAPELPDALRMQRSALEEKRRLLDRAIAAIREAEAVVATGSPAGAAVLKKIIEVIEMQQNNDWTKYANEAAREKIAARQGEWSPELQERVSKQWIELIADVQAAMDAGEDPAGPKVRALAARWKTLVEGFTQGDADLTQAASNAWKDRANWPKQMQEQAQPFKITPEMMRVHSSGSELQLKWQSLSVTAVACRGGDRAKSWERLHIPVPHAGPVALGVVRAGFPGRGDVHGSSSFEYLLAALHPIGVIAMHGEQSTAFLHHAFVALGFVFWNAHAYQRANQPAHYSTGADPGQRAHNWARGDERSEARNSQGANPRQYAQCAAYRGPRACAGGGAFGRFSVLLVGEILCAHVARQQDRDILGAEALSN